MKVLKKEILSGVSTEVDNFFVVKQQHKSKTNFSNIRRLALKPLKITEFDPDFWVV